MRLVLDTSVLRADFRLSGNEFRIFRSAIDRGQHQVYLPEVVLIEIRTLFLREVDSLRTDLQKLSRSLSRLADDEFGDAPASLEDPHAAADKYIALLEADLRFVQLPPPSIEHRILVTRAAERRKPFSEGGAGYRDALIWVSVIELAQQFDDVGLVSLNPRDFADKGGSLHRDLLDDIQSFGCHPVRYFRSLRDLHAEMPPRGVVPMEQATAVSPNGDMPESEVPQNDEVELDPSRGSASYPAIRALAKRILSDADNQLRRWLEGFPVKESSLGLPLGAVAQPLSMAQVEFEQLWLGVPRNLEGQSVLVEFELDLSAAFNVLLPATMLEPDLAGTGQEHDLVEREVERTLFLDCEGTFADDEATYRVAAVHVSEGYRTGSECAWRDVDGWKFPARPFFHGRPGSSMYDD